MCSHGQENVQQCWGDAPTSQDSNCTKLRAWFLFRPLHAFHDVVPLTQSLRNTRGHQVSRVGIHTVLRVSALCDRAMVWSEKASFDVEGGRNSSSGRRLRRSGKAPPELIASSRCRAPMQRRNVLSFQIGSALSRFGSQVQRTIDHEVAETPLHTSITYCWSSLSTYPISGWSERIHCIPRSVNFVGHS
jgi:hypothetical protein